MASLGDAFISVVADTSQLEDSLTDGLNNVLSKNVLAKGLVGSFAAASVLIVKEFLPLEGQLLQIMQVAGLAAGDELYNQISDAVLRISSDIGKPAEEVGAAIALGVGRGFDLQASEDLAGIAGNLAVALGEDLDPAVKGLTASLNGFGLGMKDADRVAGVLFQTVAKSGVPIGQLAQQIGNIAPAASNAGIGLEDVAAAVATMVQSGISAAESTTQIRTAITELSREASDGGKVFESISGKTFPDFIAKGGTLQEALELIKAASDKSGYSIQELTGNYNTANAVIALTGTATERYTQNLADNKKGTEALGTALETANSGVMRQFQVAVNDVHNGVLALGTAFRPLIQAVTAQATPVIAGFADLLAKFAGWLRTVDFTPLVDAIEWVKGRLVPFGDLIVAIFQIFSGLDWQQIGDSIMVAIAPLAAIFLSVSVAAGYLATAVEFITPGLQVLLDIVSYLAVPVAALVGLFGGFFGALAVGAATIALIAKALYLARSAILAVRTAVYLLQAAFGPWGLVVLAVTGLAVAFAYAWKKSEKFQDIVVKVVNTVKNAVVTYFEFMSTTVIGFVRTFAKMAKGIVDIVAKVPVLGGPAKGVSQWLQQRINELDAVEDKIHQVADAAKDMNWELDRAIDLSGSFSNTGGLFGIGGNDLAAAAKAIADAHKKANKPKPPKTSDPNVSGLDDLLGDDTKKKAAETARKIRDLLSGIYVDVVKFAKEIGEKSLSEISDGFDSLIQKYNDAITEAADLGQSAVVKRLKASLKTLKAYDKSITALAKKRDALDLKIDAAKDNLKDITAFNTALKNTFVELGNVTKASAGIGVTFRGIRNNLKDSIRTTTAFNTAIKKLQALNLNETSLRQIADAGPAALEQAQALARSGAKGIDEINLLQTQLDDLAQKNADNLTKEFYKLGVSAADGIVKGLQSQRDKLVAEMESLAKALTNAVKKELHIKSPSGVFEDQVGRQIPAGAALGVRRGIPDLVKAVEQMAASASNGGNGVNFGPGSVAVNGVSDPAAARRAGILLGEGISSVLEQRKTAARLAGV